MQAQLEEVRITPKADDAAVQPLRNWQADDLILGGVVLKNKIGEGGMGTVYRGLHTRFNIPVAVKVLKDPSKDSFERFLAEARLTVRVEHPNLVRVYDVNVDPISNLHYIIMEYVEGCSAHDMLVSGLNSQGRPLSQVAAIEICASAARAVGAAHAQGIVHRDLKPDNLLVRSRDGVVKVADMGIAATLKMVSEDAAAANECNGAWGTLGFASPEVLCGEPANFASDVYSLGATLYELLTGVLPYGDISSEEAYVARQMKGAPANPNEYIPELDAELCEVIMDCLKVDPAERLSDMDELATRLKDIQLRLTGERVMPRQRPTDFLVKAEQQTVLCVDDDPAILNLMAEVLSQHGFKTVCFSDPLAAVRALETVRPDVAIIDLEMPKLDGIGLVKAMRHTPCMDDVGILIFSGRNDPSKVYEALQLGVADYLIKPFGLQDLLLRVQLLARIRVMNQERNQLETQLLRMKTQCCA